MQNNVPETRKRKQPHGAWPVPGGGAARRRGRRPRRSASARRRAVRVWPVRCLCLLGLALGIAYCGTAAVGPRYERDGVQSASVSVARRGVRLPVGRGGCRAAPYPTGEDQIDDIAYWSTCIITHSDPLSGVRRLTQCAGHSSPVGSAFQLSRWPRHSRCYVHRPGERGSRAQSHTHSRIHSTGTEQGHNYRHATRYL